ncbi:MAG: hypothetical protein ACYDAR_18080, partial [Thermomicrobiales bacterium]
MDHPRHHCRPTDSDTGTHEIAPAPQGSGGDPFLLPTARCSLLAARCYRCAIPTARAAAETLASAEHGIVVRFAPLTIVVKSGALGEPPASTTLT